MALKSMSIAKLEDLRAKVDAATVEKVQFRRHELESELTKLDGYTGRGRRGRGGSRSAVAPNTATPTIRQRRGRVVA
jgi:hypothetical protein